MMEYARLVHMLDAGKAEVPLLGKMEEDIVTALGDDTMTGPEIAAKSGWKGSWLRTRLRRMVEKGLLEKVQPHGYRAIG